MLKFLKGFLVFIVSYHLIVTLFRYGVLGWAYPEVPALLRDALWFGMIFILAVWTYKHIWSYLKQWKRPRIMTWVLLVFGVTISLIKGKGFYDIFVGIKYGFLYILIFLSATYIWYLREKKQIRESQVQTNDFFRFLKYFLVTTLIVGFIWQILKFIWPDFFLHIGYETLQDFKFGAKPPIYYLTWFHGTPRWQGIFAGPNNYGYFLIAFLPAMIVLCRNKIQNAWQWIRTKKSVVNVGIIVLWILAIILTLSRTAWIGGLVALALFNSKRIKKNKELSLGMGLLAVLALVGISVLKWTSTLAHITAKFGSIRYAIQQPSGYGLGTAWPAIHHNGTILPENYYLQLILDIGTIWFLLWAVVIFQIQKICKQIKKNFVIQHEESDVRIFHIWLGLTIWRFALLIMGLFLHVFEDSMVNYLFFILWGMMTWYLFAKMS